MTTEVTINDELWDAAKKALYAGHKYMLAIDASIDSWEGGDVDTPGNAKLVDQYWDEWQSWQQKALELIEGGEE